MEKLFESFEDYLINQHSTNESKVNEESENMSMAKIKEIMVTSRKKSVKELMSFNR